MVQLPRKILVSMVIINLLLSVSLAWSSGCSCEEHTRTHHRMMDHDSNTADAIGSISHCRDSLLLHNCCLTKDVPKKTPDYLLTYVSTLSDHLIGGVVVFHQTNLTIPPICRIHQTTRVKSAIPNPPLYISNLVIRL